MPVVPQQGEGNTPDKTGVRPGGGTKEQVLGLTSTAPAASQYHSIAAAEKASQGTLPTSMVLYLAGLGKDDKHVAQLAHVYARAWSIDPAYMFGVTDPKKYISPITGEHLTLAEAQRFTDNFGVVAMTSMLKDQLVYTEGDGQKTQRGLPREKTLDPKRVGDFAKVLHTFGGDNLSLTEGIGMATRMTRDGLNPKMFAQNMDWVKRWLLTTGNSYDVHVAVNYAIQLTYNNQRMRSIADVMDAVAPGARVATERAAAAHQAVASYYGPDSPQAQNQLKAWQEGSVRTGQPVPMKALAMIGPDYWSQVKPIEDQLKLDAEAFSNSWFNRNVLRKAGWALHMTNIVYKDFWAGAVMAARYPFAAVGYVYGEAGGGNLSGQEQWNYWMDAGRYQATRLWRQQETPGSLLAEPLGEKYHWTGGAFDVGIAWATDPTVWMGKLREERLAARLLPDLLERTTGMDVVRALAGRSGVIEASTDAGAVQDAANWIKRAESFAASSESKRLFNSLDDITQYERRIYRLKGKLEARQTLDPFYMKALRDKLLEKYPTLGADAWAEWQQGITAHWSGYAPADTVAAEAINARLGRGFRADQIALDTGPVTKPYQVGLIQAPDGNLIPENDIQAYMRDAIGIPEVQAPPGFLSHEIPGGSILAEYGPRRAIRSALTSERFTESSFGQRVARIPGINPGRQLLFHQNADIYVFEHATRWGNLSEADIRLYQSRLQEIYNSGHTVPDRVEALVQEINNTGFDRYIGKWNVDTATAAKLREELLGKTDTLNAQWKTQAFGVLDKKPTGTTPLVESQLRNSIYVVDPVVVQQGIRRYISMRDRLARDLLTAANKEVPELGSKLATVGHKAVVSALDNSGAAYEAWLRMWKSFAVARPAYVTRVVLGDENLRFLATTSSLSDRLLAIGWGYRGSVEGVEGAGGVVHRFADWVSGPAKNILDKRFAYDLKIGDEVVTVPRAGAHEYEAAAAGHVRQSDIITEMIRGRDFLTPTLKADGSWDVLIATEANQAEHLKAWSWDLSMQLRNSEPGALALRSVQDGKSIEQTKLELLQWARNDNFTTLRGMGVAQDGVDIWADQLSKVVHAYTMNDENVALLALEGNRSRLEAYLAKNTAWENRPPIHAPTVSEAAGETWGNKLVNKLYSGFVRRPEDALNRQPYFSEMKKRSELAMYKQMDIAGVSATPKMRTVVDHASTNFALEQVNRVMFDFTKQSRLTELLQTVFPFPQPFFEGFQAWGHIAYRNPTALAHARILFNAGVEAGFFKKDPLSGEYMVPMNPYTWLLANLSQHFGLGGDPRLMHNIASPWAPLTSLNMLTSSSITFGASTPLIGGLIGGVPIPAPSMNPLAAAAIMKLFAGSKNTALQSYLYAYGPNPSYLPGVLKGTVAALFPGFYANDSSRQSMALGIMEAMHRNGLDKNADGSVIPLNDAERLKMGLPATTPTLEDIANQQADALFATRSIVGLFSPGPLRVTFEGQREDYQAFQAMLDAHGGDYQAAQTEWLDKFPDKFMIPIGKTLAGPGYDGQPGVRVPASELTYQLYRTKGVGDFMRANPQWAALMLIGTDPEVQNAQSFQAFSDLIAKGMQHYKTPSEYYASGESAKVWNEYDKFSKTYYALFDKGVQAHGGSASSFYSSEAYLKLKESRWQFFDSLYQTDPHWVMANLEKQQAPDGTWVWDWPSSFGDSYTPIQTVRADAHRIINIPGLGGSPGVQALRSYVDGTDAIQEKMVKLRITDITSDKAKEAGLFGQYNRLVKQVTTQTPELLPFLTNYFGVRLDDNGAVLSTSDLVFNMSETEWAFSQVPEGLRDNVVKLDEQLYKLKREARRGAWDSYDRSASYAHADNIINKTWDQSPAVLKAWWKAQGVSYRQDYMGYLASKPVEFYTAFDFHLAGIDLTKRARGWMDQISKARLEITRLGQEDTGYHPSVGYDAISAFIKAKLGQKKPDKSFAAAVNAMNTWGWGVDTNLGYGKPLDPNGPNDASNYASKGDWLWAKFLGAVRDAQVLVNKYGLQGRDWGSDADQAAYADAQKQVIALAKQYSKDNAQFKQQWQDLTEQVGDPLVGSIFFPDSYFGPVGSVT